MGYLVLVQQYQMTLSKVCYIDPVVVIIMTVKPTSNGIQLLSLKLVFF